MDGLNAAGADVFELGLVPTPVAYFAAHHLGCRSAAMITGSHNPGEYNGVKMVVADAALTGDEIQGLRRSIEDGRLASGAGRRSRTDVLDAYVERIAGDAKLARPLRVAVDCGNGVAGVVAPRLFRRLGWGPDEYETWWRRALEAQIGFVQPSSWEGEKVARLCFVNPRTTIDHVRAILGTMA